MVIGTQEDEKLRLGMAFTEFETVKISCQSIYC
jgi:hypothetical protein